MPSQQKPEAVPLSYQSMEIPVPNYFWKCFSRPIFLWIVHQFFEWDGGGGGTKGFSVLYNVQTLYGVHPDFCLTITGELLWGVKLTTHLHLASGVEGVVSFPQAYGQLYLRSHVISDLFNEPGEAN